MLLIIALTICSLFSGVTHVSGGRPVTIEAVAADECEGDACSQVTVTFEESKERYKVQNNSSDHWVRVEAANLAATATTCVEPGKESYLSLKSIAGAYKAKFDATCAPN